MHDGYKHGYSTRSPNLASRRPMPADFWETYVRIGWAEIREHYATHTRVIRRWIREAGYPELAAARTAYLKAKRDQERPERKRRARLARLARQYHEW